MNLRRLPGLSRLYLRHPGLTRPVCQVLVETVAVCLARHHLPPALFVIGRGRTGSTSVRVDWRPPSDRQQAAHKNFIDTTELGAYGISLAAIEAELGLVALSRADTLSGADYLVGKPEADSLEEALRLEVSGVDYGDMTDVERRVRIKVAQVRKPSDDAWLVSVVAFRQKAVRIEAQS